VKVLVIGSGAKEHAVTWAFSKSHRISALYIAPGNAGTQQIGENIPDLDTTDPAQVLEACKSRNIDFVFCGTEASQAAGVVNSLCEAGFSVFGATKEAARIESDRWFAEEFMHRHGIHTVHSELIRNTEELEGYLEAHPGRIVLKKNGLTRFARSFESDSREELLEFGLHILAEDVLIAEPYIEGYNLSVIAFVDGQNYLALPPASDYTKAHDNEEGVLTSGMGAVCPVPIVCSEAYQRIIESVVEPTIEGLKQEGLFYRGVLFISLIVNDEDSLVTSYHVRLGDPEAQVIAPLIQSDFGNLMEAIQNQTLNSFSLSLSQDSAVGVVVAGEAYPYKIYEDIPVHIESPVPERDILIFHGATYTKNGSKQIYTNGRRSFTVVGLGENIVKANSKAYRGIKRIRFDGAWTRSDIGNNFFIS